MIRIFDSFTSACVQSSEGPEKNLSCGMLLESQGLIKVKQLVEQKRLVERELGELKAQLEKAGFSSVSQMRSFFEILNSKLICFVSSSVTVNAYDSS